MENKSILIPGPLNRRITPDSWDSWNKQLFAGEPTVAVHTPVDFFRSQRQEAASIVITEWM